MVACVLGYYVHKAGFQRVLFDLVIFPSRFMPLSEVNTPRTYIRQLAQFLNFRRPSEIAFLIPAFFIYALVPYVYVAGLYQLWRRRAVLPSTLQRNLILLHVVGLGLFLGIAHGPRHFRLCTVAPPAILIFVWLLTLPIPALGYIRKLSWVLAGCYLILLPVSRQVQWHGKARFANRPNRFHRQGTVAKISMGGGTHASIGWILQRLGSQPLFVAAQPYTNRVRDLR